MAGDAPVANSLKMRSFLSFFPSSVKDKYFASTVGVLLPLSLSEEPVMVFRGLLFFFLRNVYDPYNSVASLQLGFFFLLTLDRFSLNSAQSHCY